MVMLLSSPTITMTDFTLSHIILILSKSSILVMSNTKLGSNKYQVIDLNRQRFERKTFKQSIFGLRENIEWYQSHIIKGYAIALKEHDPT